MEAALHIVGAFDTFPTQVVAIDDLHAELCRRGLADADARLAIERSLLEGLLLPSPGGRVRKAVDLGERVEVRHRVDGSGV